ncbi:hypothetical protein GGF46_000375 [Coemansia sp. RSA 552]|nr:hypothetical protein GGF46_000375 [Coemansia sp. RSA 552]
MDEVDDIHGFFQFASGSDSDDDGLFGATRERKKAFDLSQIDYTPLIDEDGWFDRSGSLSMAEWISQHSGLDEVMFTIQRLYFRQEYARTCELCWEAAKEYMAANHRRIANIRELLDIGARSAIHVGDMESTQYFYDIYMQCGGKNPGYSAFLAKVLTALGRREEALQHHIEYLERRAQDAAVWESIGQLLVDIAEQNICREPLLRLALGAFCKAHTIIGSCKNWRNVDYAIRRREVQTRGLAQSACRAMALLPVALDSRGGDAGECAELWSQVQNESSADQAGALRKHLSEPLMAATEWISGQLSSSKHSDSPENASEDEKDVTEL